MGFADYLKTTKGYNVDSSLSDAQLGSTLPDDYKAYLSTINPVAPDNTYTPAAPDPAPTPGTQVGAGTTSPSIIGPVKVQQDVVTNNIKTADNTEYTQTYTDPSTGKTAQVTQQQLLALQEWEKFKAGNSVLNQAQITSLLSKAYMDANAPQNNQQPDGGGGGDPGTNGPNAGSPAVDTTTEAVDTTTKDAGPDPGDQPPTEPPAPGDPPPTEQVPPEVVANPPEGSLIKDYLESDPNLILNAILNDFKAGGASAHFGNWFRGQFNNFYGSYLGYLGNAALEGKITGLLSFVDYMGQYNSVRAYYASTPYQRGDPTARTASYITNTAAS